MDVLLLGAGAIVLIGITLWIVWSARDADSGGDATVRIEEVVNNTMTQNDRPSMPPQGSTFEDQYTSATADLSAGGVATAVEAMQEDLPAPVTPVWPQAPAAGERIGQPSQSDRFPYGSPVAEPPAIARPKTLGIGAGAALSLGGAVGGAWLYARWQRERNKPINRLRRGARDMGKRLGDRLPDVVDDLPIGAGPLGGVATALLLSGLMVSRALRRDSGSQTEEVRDQATDIVRASLHEALGYGRDAMDRGRDVVDSGRAQARRFPVDRLTSRFEAIEPRKTGVMGLGFGGLAVVAGGIFMIWRLLRGAGRKPPSQPWYAGE